MRLCSDGLPPMMTGRFRDAEAKCGFCGRTNTEGGWTTYFRGGVLCRCGCVTYLSEKELEALRIKER